jgi:hypothetical protein
LALTIAQHSRREGHRRQLPVSQRDRAVVGRTGLGSDVASTAADTLMPRLRDHAGNSLPVLDPGHFLIREGGAEPLIQRSEVQDQAVAVAAAADVD